MTKEMTAAEADLLAEIRSLLQGDEPVRIELGTSFSLSGNGSFASARLFRHKGNRWSKVGPVILPPDGGGRPELLSLLSRLTDGEI